MELFRVGGDVPDTNYLFMGTNSLFLLMILSSPKPVKLTHVIIR